LPEVADLVESAFSRLNSRAGFVERHDQKQLALLVADCVEGSDSAALEAPTGLGKSLAALIPAIAHALTSGKRTIISTFTNILAEQYWRSDLPLALSLFDGDPPKCEFLIGRQRYACLVHIAESRNGMAQSFTRRAELGIESEFRDHFQGKPADLGSLWSNIAAPPVCPARMCERYERCFYYRARRSAERAHVVITNHSVVMQDALLRDASDSDSSLLGEYDYLIVDEAHDFPNAAAGSLEFELSEARLGVLTGVINRAEQSVLQIAAQAETLRDWSESCERYRERLAGCLSELRAYGGEVRRNGVLAASPDAVWGHPVVRSHASTEGIDRAKAVADSVAAASEAFLDSARSTMRNWEESDLGKGLTESAKVTLRNFLLYVREFELGSRSLFSPIGVSISHASRDGEAANIRFDTVGLADPLRNLLWERKPATCMSATLAIDGSFDFFKEVTGFRPRFEEILPSPFDYRSNVSLYIPMHGAILDPSEARKNDRESDYYESVATELARIIGAMRGRTLVLFHSRREMEAVSDLIPRLPGYPIYVQRASGVASVGERFKREVSSSLLALRSFWTGFDAPGETLSCVAIVRVPFEVPVDPPQLARQAWLESEGRNPFRDYTLPVAKMLVRQGVGRLIRRSEDRGVIALLDPRLTTKFYGPQILENLPPGIRSFHDIWDAIAAAGISSEADPESPASPAADDAETQ
jgi:Rad3-related DNA helicase